MKQFPNRVVLDETHTPKSWYNMFADMPFEEGEDAFMLHPGTMQPAKPEDLYPVFAEELCRQEFTRERHIEIPKEVRDYYLSYRPSPMYRAYALEKLLDTPAHIYFKYEGQNTSGSHKLNSAIAQAYYNKKQGVKRLTTETGAGQWGTALSMACAHFGLELEVFMVKISAQQKPYRKAIIETFGADITLSPSNTTNAGRGVLENDPDNPGSLGTAISEAVERAVTSENTRYTLGSVLNQVVIHQSVIGLEAKEQLGMYDVYPDIIIGCAGGGSNFAGLMSAFMGDRLTGKAKPYFIAVEPAACPSMTRGRYAYDFCDTARVTPLAKMYTLGCGFMPSTIHAGGLRYHGMSPTLSKLYHDGFIDEARGAFQSEIFKAATIFTRAEGILPAPESAHAISAAIDEANKCKETGVAKNILFGLSGHGNFDLGAYMQYMEGNTHDYAPTDNELEKGFASLIKTNS
ncbi:MAG: TrpB-like pyridoxal phosphate-dependent enzyme [Defluviitaleaceae bacterium]|nr:TrpB-like pyridoxal phosphate-dependent enzyme [Defluviitaleaceae bacterium]